MKSLLALSLALCLPGQAQTRVEISRDAWISAYKTEVEGNNGGSHKLKLKGIQEFFLADFDPAPFQGKKVTRAELHLHLLSPETPLRRTTVSSISQEWVEGTGTSYAKVPGASSFVWAHTGEQRWGKNGDEADITAVVCGEGGSLWGFGEATPPDAQGWQRIPVSPEVVQARLDGHSHGFFIIDDVGNEYTRNGDAFTYTNFVNRNVSSREDQRAYRPFFMLWIEEGITSHSTGYSQSLYPVQSPAVLPEMTKPAKVDLETETAWSDIFGEKLTTAHFFAAKGESIGFRLAANLRDVSVNLPGLKVKLHAMPKVAGFHDPLVPAGFDPGEVETDLAGADTFIELYVPKNTPAGRLDGTVTVKGAPQSMVVTVWNFTLPDQLSFIPQMNAYSLPSHPRDYYRLAHEHRLVVNQLPYGWVGRVDEPAPKIKEGRWDWAAFDAEFGPLLDGSAFADLPRGAIPVDAFYLLLNENWPMPHDALFKGGYWIENAYAESYWTQFRAAAAEIARHIEEKGWTAPVFEFYLNNKVYNKKDDWRKCTAAWIFDEPVHTQDFWAIRHYGQEFWSAVAPFTKVHLGYRADISRPQWQRDLLDHNTNVEVVSGVLRTYWPRVARRAADCGNQIYMYGTASPLGSPYVACAAWCVESWSHGAGGVVPWNSIGKPSAWETPDEISLFYPTPNGPVPSLRLKAFSAGQQIVEYLEQYAAASGQSRESVMAAIRAIPGLSASLVKKNEEDAGSSQFGVETGAAFGALRLRLGHFLDAKASPPKERWHDPRPRRPDRTRARQIQPLISPG